MDPGSWAIIIFFVLVVLILIGVGIYFAFFRNKGVTGMGACCVNNVCSQQTQANCAGNFFGVGVACTANICGSSPTGACCSSSNVCTVTTSSACNGTYQGDGTPCSSGICSNPVNPIPLNTPIAIVANNADSNGVISHGNTITAALPNWNCDMMQQFTINNSDIYYTFSPIGNMNIVLDASIINPSGIELTINQMQSPIQQTALWDLEPSSVRNNFFTIRNVGQSISTGTNQFLSTGNGIDNLIILQPEPGITVPTTDNSIFEFVPINSNGCGTVPYNGSCSSGSECQSGLYCANSVCQNGSLGNFCTSSSQCQSGNCAPIPRTNNFACQ